MKDNLMFLYRIIVLYLFFLVIPSNTFGDMRIDPHGKREMCSHCHISETVHKGEKKFRLDTIEATCLACHAKMGDSLDEYLKRMIPDVEIKKEMIKYFTKQADFSCHTCHYVMCQSGSRKELQLRDPHIQLNKEGKIIEKTCLFCHIKVPDYKKPSFKDAVIRYDVSYFCSLCHVMSSQKRGLGFGKPMTTDMVLRKKAFEEKYDISLPLGPNNTVICASCHNPHQQGVILGKGGYSNASGDHRLVSDDPWKLCTACHLVNLN